MNEDYLIKLHQELGIKDDFNTWLNAVKDNDEYLSKVHQSLGVVDNFNIWKSKVIGENPKQSKALSNEVKKDDFVSSIPGLKEKLVKTQETKTPKVSVSSPKKTTATKVEEPITGFKFPEANYRYKEENGKAAWSKSTDGDKTFEVVDATNIPESWSKDPQFKLALAGQKGAAIIDGVVYNNFQEYRDREGNTKDDKFSGTIFHPLQYLRKDSRADEETHVTKLKDDEAEYAKALDIDASQLKERIKSEEGEDRNALEFIKSYGANLGLGAVSIADNFTKLYETGEAGFLGEVIFENPFVASYGYSAEYLRGKGYDIPEEFLGIDLTTPGMRREIYENHMLDAREKGLTLEQAQKLDPTNKIKFEETLEWFNKHTYTYKDENGDPMDYLSLVSDGKVLEAADAFVNDAFGAVPSLVVSRLPYGSGAAILGAGAYMDNFEREMYKRGFDDETTRNQVVLDSFINGASDFTMELIGGRILNNIIGKGIPKDKAKDLLTNIPKVIATKFFKGYASEFGTEGLTGVMQTQSKEWSYGDIVTYKQNLRAFFKDGFLGGFLGGSATIMSTPNQRQVYDYVSPSVYKQEQLKIEKEIVGLTKDADKAEGSNKEILEEKIKELQDKKELNKKNLYEFFNSLTKAEKQEYANNIDGQHKNLDIIGNSEHSEATQKKAKEDYKKFTDANSKFFAGIDIDYDSDLEQAIGRTLKASERIQEQKGFFGYNKKNLEIEYVDSDSRLKELSEQYKGFNEADGMFVPPSEGGKTKIYINNRVAAFTGQTNVIGHEYLHAIVSRAFSGNINASKLSGSVLSFVDYLKSTGKDGERIIERIEERLANKYEGRDAEGNIIRDSHGLVKTKDKANQEEYFNLFGDIIKNEKIDAVEAKSSGIKNSFRSLIRGFGFGEVDFQSGQEVFDFLVDYNTNTSRESFLGKLTSRGVANVKMKGLESEVSDGITDTKAGERKVNHTNTDSKGNTYTYFANTTGKGGVTTTKFTFNRSDKASTQRSAGGVPTQVALGDNYTIDPKDQYEGFEITQVLEIRESETGASATVRYQNAKGESFNGEVVLVPTTSTKATAADTKDGKFSRSTVNLDEGKGELHEKIDALTNNAKTKAEFQERTKENGRFSAFENVYTGILEGRFDRIFGKNIDLEIKEKQRENLADRLINYDPAKTPELSKWMYGGSGKAGNIRYSGLTALHKQWTEDQNKNKLTSIDTEEAKDVIDMTTSAPDAYMETSQSDVKDVKLRDLKDFDVYLDDTFGNELAIAEVNGILSRFENGDISLEKAKSLMTEVTLKDIRAALSESIPKIAKDKASGITKPTPEYESWIRSEYSEIVQSLDIKTIRKYKFFEATVTGKKDYKNINPLTGKVSNFVKPTQVNTTNKREYLRYFLEGKPNDLIERRTALIRRIAERKTSLAVDNYIIDNSNNVEAVILSTMKNLSSTPIIIKGEQTSFDTVKFSKSFTAKEIADIEKNGENIIEITTRLERGEPFDLVLLQNVFRDKQGPLREWLSNEFMKRKGLTAEDNMLRDYKLTDDEYAQLEKEAAESSKKIAEANGIDPGRVSLVNVNDNPKLIKQRVDHHIKLLNFMPFHHSKMPSEAITALITELGWNSRSRKEYGKNLNLTNKNKSITIDNYYGANVFLNNGKAYDGRYDACYTPKNFGALKRAIAKEGKRLMEQVKLGNITRVEAEMQYVDFVRGKFSYNGKSSGYDATIKANETLATDFYMARFKAAKAEKPIKVNGVEIDIAKENILVHNAMQSNISTGITKAFVYNLNTVAFEGSKPGTYEFKNKKGEVKEYTTTDELHWEHERQLLNNNEHFFNLVNRHKTASPKMLSELELFIKTSTQSLIEKSLQLENDAQGTTSYGPKYSGNLAEQALLNFLTRKGVENNQLIMSGPYKGMRLSDSLAAKYTVSELEAALSKLPKGTLNSTALTIKAGVKSKSEFKNLETIDTAVKFSRTANPAKGISVLDFDDTLATTKSGVRYTLPNPDGTPQPKKKVIFMAGGPGSGKSNVINQLGLKEQGFKVVNQDISLEWLMKNHGMPTDMREFTPEQASEFGKLSAQAREIALKKRIKYQGEGDGVVIDGTGASLNVMKKNIQDFKDKGYDVQMIFVETSQETSS
jgi:hypothetical protein